MVELKNMFFIDFSNNCFIFYFVIFAHNLRLLRKILSKCHITRSAKFNTCFTLNKDNVNKDIYCTKIKYNTLIN